MINLLPPEEKRQLAAARTNTLLLRYCMLTLGVVGLLLAEVAGMYIVVNSGTAQNQAVIQENEQKAAVYASTQAEATKFKSDLSTAKYILGKQVSYTSLLYTYANALPPGTSLFAAALNPSTFGKETTLMVGIDSYEKAIAVKTALQKAMINGNENLPLFTLVKFVSVAVNTESTANYPFTANFNVVYSRAVPTQ